MRLGSGPVLCVLQCPRPPKKEVPFVLQYARRPKLEKPHGLALADVSGISGIGIT